MESHSARLAWGECRAWLSTSWHQGLALSPQHSWHTGEPILLGDRSPRGLSLFLCPTSILGYCQPHSHGKPLTVPRHWGRRGVTVPHAQG